MKPRYQIITLYFSIVSLVKHRNGWNVPFVVSKNCQPKKNIMVSITGFIYLSIVRVFNFRFTVGVFADCRYFLRISR